jgi:hypothetical protein
MELPLSLRPRIVLDFGEMAAVILVFGNDFRVRPRSLEGAVVS